MSYRHFIIALLALACAACASGPQDRAASEELAPEPVVPAPEKVDVDEYLEFLDKMHVAVGDGVPRELSPAERRRFQQIDSELRSILEGVDNIDELSGNRQLTVFNLHQELQGVVIGDPEHYLICRREHRVGTNFKDTRCIPAGDFRRSQETHRDHLRKVIGAGPMPQPDQP